MTKLRTDDPAISEGSVHAPVHVKNLPGVVAVTRCSHGVKGRYRPRIFDVYAGSSGCELPVRAQLVIFLCSFPCPDSTC